MFLSFLIRLISLFYYGGCPSDPMMMFAFCNSSMNMEVALQPQLRGTESWTVGALEVSCCDHCRGCSAVCVCLSGSSEFLASSLFEVGSSSVNRALPFWSVHGISLPVSPIDVAPLEIGFDRVFIPQFWSTLVSFLFYYTTKDNMLINSHVKTRKSIPQLFINIPNFLNLPDKKASVLSQAKS